MEKITFFGICILAAVFEGYKAEPEVHLPATHLRNAPSLADLPNPSLGDLTNPSLEDLASLENLSSLEARSEDVSIADRTELQIINLCTEVPLSYDEFITTFLNDGSLSPENIERMRNIEADLKLKTDDLRKYVTTYDESVSSHDPDAANIQKLMSSAVDELIQSVNQINSELGPNSNSAIAEVEDRARIIQENVRPAMVKFEESCLLQTKDILKNVLSDYEASLMS